MILTIVLCLLSYIVGVLFIRDEVWRNWDRYNIFGKLCTVIFGLSGLVGIVFCLVAVSLGIFIMAGISYIGDNCKKKEYR